MLGFRKRLERNLIKRFDIDDKTARKIIRLYIDKCVRTIKRKEFLSMGLLGSIHVDKRRGTWVEGFGGEFFYVPSRFYPVYQQSAKLAYKMRMKRNEQEAQKEVQLPHSPP